MNDLEWLGPLEPSELFKGEFQTRPIPLGLFPDTSIAVQLESGVEDDLPRLARVLRSFASLGEADRSKSAPRIYANYKYVLHWMTETYSKDVTSRMPKISTPDAIWAHLSLLDVSVMTEDDGSWYVMVEANCPWEVEHGLQLVFREGAELSRVSQCDCEPTGPDDA